MINKFIKIAGVVSILLFTLPAFSQNRTTFELQWEMNKLEGQDVLSIKGFGYSLTKLPRFVHKIKIPSNSSVTSLVKVLTSEKLTQLEVNSLSDELKQKVTNSFKREVDYGKQRKIEYAIFSLVPLYKKDGEIYKVTSFELSYSVSSRRMISSNRGIRGFKANSVLASGDIYKLSVKENGVYKVTFEFLKSNGALSTEINSSLINVYGNHNGMLPEKNGEFRIDDLEKNAIQIVDGGDGKFGEGDYLLFYGQGPDKWRFNSSSSSFEFDKHLYSDVANYFIKLNDNSGGKRITDLPYASAPHTQTVTTFNDFKAKEDEVHNLMQLKNKGGSGKLWVGTIFDAVLSRNVGFSFPNIETSSQVNITTSVLANTPFPTSSSFTVSIGSIANTVISIPGLNQGVHNSVALRRNGNLSFTPTSSFINVNFLYNKPIGISGVGYLDYIEVNARRKLIMDNNQLEFRDITSVGTGNKAKFEISSASTIHKVWDVTNPLEVLSIGYTESSGTLSFYQNADSLRTYIAFKNTGFLIPTFVQKVENQNLHAELIPDMLLVYHPIFENQVDQLKKFHEGNGLTVVKATVGQIYNEFSGGIQDVTAIKTFAKMFYDKGGMNPPKYLLLFGDGSYDYKNRVNPNHNFVPVWESENSLADVTSYTTDDFYALLDDGESMGDNELMDIAVGRLTVTNTGQAQTVVNKIINYQKQGVTLSQVSSCNDANSGSPFGDWRNKICFVTDDMDAQWEGSFFTHTERTMDSIKKNHPSFNLQKIHMDAYKQTSVSGGERYYEGMEALRRTVEEGTLITTYEGHGGEVGWGTERFLDIPMINGWTNINRLSVFLTATCEFTKYDDPSRTSAGELCILNPNGGAVAMFTTTRPVFQFSNEQLITAFFEEVFVKKADGTPRTLGEIYMETKNNSRVIGDNNARRFGLIGDPALNLAFPKHQVITTEINNTPISSTTDTLKALSKITIKGYVASASGAILTGYNGVVFPTVFDKPTQLATLGNRQPSDIFPFEIQNSVLYKGKASVKNGLFEFTFLVPKDINYQFGKGKISYYCYDGKEDGTGYFLDAIVGGTNTNAILDNQGPTVGLYMNDNSFVSGGITGDSPSIYAEIFDSNGINTTGNGIGHDLTAILDEKTTNPIILNNYYESDLDSYQSGKINYPLSKLEDGNHTLTLKSWDIHNNSTDATVDFVVVKSQELAIEHVLNYPNPFTTRTQFFFEHNQACEFLQVQIQVFTVSGKLVKTINQLVKTKGFRAEAIEWDGKDDYGDKIGRGTYVYKVKVTDENGNNVEKYEKLVLLK